MAKLDIFFLVCYNWPDFIDCLCTELTETDYQHIKTLSYKYFSQGFKNKIFLTEVKIQPTP